VTWAWLDLVASRPAGAQGTAEVRGADDAPAGVLAWWDRHDDRPTPTALRVDARIVSGGGTATWVSWCRTSGGMSFAFDDGAVSGALRRRLQAAVWPEAVSTLLVDWARIGGAITTGVRSSDVGADPFAVVFPRTMLRVEAGALGSIPQPTGPGIARYGSGNPWPWDVYRGQVT
jgi:hypothetical protein